MKKKLALFTVIVIALLGVSGWWLPRLNRERLPAYWNPIIPVPSAGGLIMYANLIVTGKIKRIERMAAPIRNAHPLATEIPWLHPLRITIQVEEVIEGPAGKSAPIELKVMTALVAKTWWQSIPSVSEMSSKQLHYISTTYSSVDSFENSFYVADLSNSSTNLEGSSASIMNRTDRILAVRKQLIRTLIPQTCEIRSNVKNVRHAAVRAASIGGFMATLPTLQFLLECPNDDLKREICLEMYNLGFQGQISCLDKLTFGEADLSFSDRELFARRRYLEQDFRKRFLEDPIKTSASTSNLRGQEGLVDFLQMIALHPSKDLASLAREMLNHL